MEQLHNHIEDFCAVMQQLGYQGRFRASSIAGDDLKSCLQNYFRSAQPGASEAGRCTLSLECYSDVPAPDADKTMCRFQSAYYPHMGFTIYNMEIIRQSPADKKLAKIEFPVTCMEMLPSPRSANSMMEKELAKQRLKPKAVLRH